MKKIDKTNILSTKYKDWEEGLESHPVYNSSNNKYYKDIVMNLLYVQKGFGIPIKINQFPTAFKMCKIDNN